MRVNERAATPRASAGARRAPSARLVAAIVFSVSTCLPIPSACSAYSAWSPMGSAM